jgi:hypothetical protein
LKASKAVPERTSNNKKQPTLTSSKTAGEELKEELDPFLVPNKVVTKLYINNTI